MAHPYYSPCKGRNYLIDCVFNIFYKFVVWKSQATRHVSGLLHGPDSGAVYSGILISKNLKKAVSRTNFIFNFWSYETNKAVHLMPFHRLKKVKKKPENLKPSWFFGIKDFVERCSAVNVFLDFQNFVGYNSCYTNTKVEKYQISSFDMKCI